MKRERGSVERAVGKEGRDEKGDRDGQRRVGEKKERETGKMKENEGYRDIRVSKIQSLAFQSTLKMAY